MDLVERIGEATFRAAGRVYYHALGFLIKLILLLRKLRTYLGEVDARRIYPLFEKRGVEFQDYVILKTQLFTFLFFILAVLLIFDFISLKTTIPLLIISGLLSLSLTFGQVKDYFSEDYLPYRDFFLTYFSITLLLLIFKVIVPQVAWRYPYIHFLLASLVAVAAFSTYFKRRYARDYTFGRVIKEGSIARVKVNYDIRAGVKPGVHTLPNDVNAREGDLVKLRVEKSFFNLRGSRVTEILEVLTDAQQRGG
jgi:uncharacterized membrane protein